jgi:hypothetical protein
MAAIDLGCGHIFDLPSLGIPTIPFSAAHSIIVSHVEITNNNNTELFYYPSQFDEKKT